MRPVYIHTDILELEDMYGPILTDYMSFTIYERLDRMSFLLMNGIRDGVHAAFKEVSNYHPDFLGKSSKEILESGFGHGDARQTLASEYGFQDWRAVIREANRPHDVFFEEAVDHMMNGEIEILSERLARHDDLINRRSNYPHQASLLLYCGTNGVEFYRQRVPSNLGGIIRLLVNLGADTEATMSVYGGRFTFLQLLRTSAHPKDAGMMEKLGESFESLGLS